VRAVEEGFTLFRPTSSGRSVAVTAYGDVLASTDLQTDAMVAMLTVGPGTTWYGATGDLLAWICVGTLAMLLLRAGPLTPRAGG
jgi:apolipoprotein N-acyltransferase